MKCLTIAFGCVLLSQSAVRADEALDEVNAARMARGLRPFIRDDGLTQAAASCAEFRASHLMFGHTSNDFAFLPPGVSASSAGCAAYDASLGWLSCCTYENYTHAGAAYSIGRDGKRYMHLFVRSEAPSQPTAMWADAPAQPTAMWATPVPCSRRIVSRRWR